MTKVVHGGDIYSYDQELLDFSSNINPLGIPPKAQEVLQGDWEHLKRYPDVDYRSLRQMIAEEHGLSPEQVIVGNGAAEIIFLIGQLFVDKKVLIPMPTFGEYQAGVELAQGSVEVVLRDEKDNFRLPLEEILRKLLSVDGVILCNPNNPTGGLVLTEDLEILIKETSKLGKFLVLDEAFIDFTPPEKRVSGVKWLQSEMYPNLLVIRAFTKFYGMPGLRLGYGLGSQQLIDRLIHRQIPWSVNSLAEIIGKAVLADQQYRQRSEEWMCAEREFFVDNLQQISQIKVFPTDANFVLCQLLDKRLTVKDLKQKLVGKGILIRDASSFVGLDASYFRLAIKKRNDHLRLLQVLQEVL